MRKFILGSAAGVTLAGLLGAAAPSAAQAQAPGGETLGEVVVTARRIQERLQDVQISITVYNQEQIA